MRLRISKPRKLFSNEQKLQYAKMVVEEGYKVIKVATITDASTSTVGRWKRQYLKKKQGLKKVLAKAALDNGIKQSVIDCRSCSSF